jgi:VCBS repeat-containing protein
MLWRLKSGTGAILQDTPNITNWPRVGYQAAIDAAEIYLSDEFTNHVTVNVTFDLSLNTPSGTAAAQTPVYYGMNYLSSSGQTGLLEALMTHATSTDQLAAVAALQKLSDPSNGVGFQVPQGMARMLGLFLSPFPGDTTTPDDTVTLNSFIWNAITLSPGGPLAAEAQAAIEHELSEGIMGRIGSLGFNGSWKPMDLFRFTSTGQRDFSGSYNTPTYFSPDGSFIDTGLQYHTLDPSGKYNGDDKSTSPDLADWDTVGDNADDTDPFGDSSFITSNIFSPTDLSIMDVLGWTRADLPDLIVSSITPVTTSVPQGTDLSFSYVIKNQGGGSAGQNVETWWLDASQAPPTFVGSDTLSSLASGATHSFSDSISTAGLSFGTHTLYVEADALKALNESNATNNVTSITFTVTEPDLIVSSITPTSTSVPLGTSLNFSYVITNQGNLAAGPSVEAWQVDGKPTPTSFLGSDTLMRLAAGGSQSFSDSISTLHLSVGPHTLWVAADDTNLVNGDQTNNLNSITFTVAPPLPPTVVPDRTGVNVGASVTVDAAHGVLANDTGPASGDGRGANVDESSDALQVSTVDGQVVNVGSPTTVQGTFGSLTLSSDGSYTYAASSSAALPASGVGQDVFTYTAITEAGGTANSTLTVVVMDTGFTYLGGKPGVTITGGRGHSPVLDGGAGNDTLVATKGATTLIGGPGDTLTGGKGADTYVFLGQFGQDTITNYNPNKDIIELDHTWFADLFAVQLAASQQVGSNNTIITDKRGDSVTLVGTSLSQLHFDASHFLLG